jgi:hypothetical protein
VVGFCEHGNEPSCSIKKSGYFCQAERLSAFQIISCTLEQVNKQTGREETTREQSVDGAVILR